MADLILLDGREKAYQWDTNISVELQDVVADELHFAVRGSNVAVVRELDENNQCVIPDVCLQTSGELKVYAFRRNTSNYTNDAFIINVIARAKPIDYIEPEAEETLVDLIALRLKSDPEFIEATKGEEGDPGEDGVSPTVTVTDITGGHRITITDATGDHVFDVMDGQGGGGTTGVYSVNGRTGTVVLNASDVGADASGTAASVQDNLDAHAETTAIHTTATEKSSWNGKYSKPANGIPKSDLASGVQSSLDKADTALQEHQSLSGYATTASVNAISAKIPNEASSSNQLADKAFVNSTVGTNTAIFRGTFNTLAELQALTDKTNNDYGFVIETDSAGNVVYNRYKYNGTSWVFEYALNNSSFTAAQWAAIESGITSDSVEDYDSHIANTAIHVDSTEKNTWNGKYSKPSTGIPKTDLSSDVQTSLRKADSAIQDVSDKENLGKLTINNVEYTLRVGTTGAAGYITFVLE